MKGTEMLKPKVSNEGLIDYKDGENRTISVIGYRYTKRGIKPYFRF